MPEKAYWTYDEAMKYLKVKRSTLYTIVGELGIETHKFRGNKHRYLAAADVERIKHLRKLQREQPWEIEKREEIPV